MPSPIDICNLALSKLGDTASVSSLDPAEGSAQAEHCARWYPVALASLLERHNWNFATRRETLALRVETSNQWEYTYEYPNQAARVFAVIDTEATDDADPQPFVVEANSAGQRIIRTNQVDADARFIHAAPDAETFPKTLKVALVWHLASMLAGPILKGAEGAAEAKRCEQFFMLELGSAKAADVNQRRIVLTHTPPWIGGR
jgi:hypothetical protein